MEEYVCAYQFGFLKGRSTADALFHIERLREQCVEYEHVKHLTQVDFTKAFDKVHRNTIKKRWKLQVYKTTSLKDV